MRFITELSPRIGQPLELHRLTHLPYIAAGWHFDIAVCATGTEQVGRTAAWQRLQAPMLFCAAAAIRMAEHEPDSRFVRVNRVRERSERMISARRRVSTEAANGRRHVAMEAQMGGQRIAGEPEQALVTTLGKQQRFARFLPNFVEDDVTTGPMNRVGHQVVSSRRDSPGEHDDVTILHGSERRNDCVAVVDGVQDSRWSDSPDRRHGCQHRSVRIADLSRILATGRPRPVHHQS